MIFRPLAPLLKIAAAAFAVLLLVDLSLFRSGLYYRWAEPDSTAGSVVRAQITIRHDYEPDRRNVLVLGSSRIGEGFSALLADAASGRDDLHFINGSIAGTSPRVWYYLLRAIDPDANRFAAIALMVDYDVAETRLDLTNYALDTPYLLPLLRVADLDSYPASFTEADQRERARRGILLPLQAMHDDVLNFVAHPFARRHVVRSSRRGAAWWAAHYPGRDEALPNLQLGADGEPVDWGADAAQLKPRLEGYFHELRDKPPAALQDANAAYLREWLGRIAERYAPHHVPVIAFVVPRGPWHGSQSRAPAIGGPVAELVERGRIVALPGDAFVELEQSQFFFDASHMNRNGRERFSRKFAQDIAAQLH
jgi:hypothetical protein